MNELFTSVIFFFILNFLMFFFCRFEKKYKLLDISVFFRLLRNYKTSSRRGLCSPTEISHVRIFFDIILVVSSRYYFKFVFFSCQTQLVMCSLTIFLLFEKSNFKTGSKLCIFKPQSFCRVIYLRK